MAVSGAHIVRHEQGDKPAQCVVYAAINKRSGKMYVGATERGMRHRSMQHLAAARRGQKCVFYSAIRKYGEGNFKFVELRQCNDFFHALAAERDYIALFKPEYNMTAGGGGVKGLKMSDEARAKMSLAKIGKPSLKRGVPMSLEQREKLKKCGPQLREAQRLWRERHGGNPPISDKQKAHNAQFHKIGNAARRRRVECVTDGIIYDSVTAAGRAHGLTSGQVSVYCKGVINSRRGLVFRYPEDTQ